MHEYLYMHIHSIIYTYIQTMATPRGIRVLRNIRVDPRLTLLLGVRIRGTLGDVDLLN